MLLGYAVVVQPQLHGSPLHRASIKIASLPGFLWVTSTSCGWLCSWDTAFFKELASAAFENCKIRLVFIFISTYVNFTGVKMAYHDPIDVLDFCLKNLTRRVTMCHHYELCDVAVFLYR